MRYSFLSFSLDINLYVSLFCWQDVEKETIRSNLRGKKNVNVNNSNILFNRMDWYIYKRTLILKAQNPKCKGMLQVVNLYYNRKLLPL